MSERDTMFDPGPCVYTEKIAVGGEAVGAVSIEASATDNIPAVTHPVTHAKRESVRGVTAVILDRPRHHALDTRHRLKTLALYTAMHSE